MSDADTGKVWPRSEAGAAPAAARPQIGVIWAQTPSGVIGRGGDMPWHAPADMAHFKRTTMGHPVIMGRRTWESIPPRFRPFDGRTNIVLTSDAAVADEVRRAGGFVCATLDAAIALAEDQPGGDLVWVVGGGAVYAAAVPLADLAVITVLDLAVDDGDTFAPVLGDGFRLESASPAAGFEQPAKGPAHRFETWRRVAG